MIHAQNLEMLRTPALSFTLNDGLVHGLVGPNGIGKTTLLRMIAGQHDSTGLEVYGEQPFDNSQVMDRTILMGIDNPLPEGWNMKKLFQLGKSRWKTWNDQRADELIERFGLPMTNYSGLSRGQKSAAGIIMAVASGCELMLLDEPYLGLDHQRRQVFFDVLREERGRTIVISTHHLAEVSDYLDTVLQLGENPMFHTVDDLLNAVVEIAGTEDKLTLFLRDLSLPVLHRDSSALGDKALVDARSTDITELFERVNAAGLRTANVGLEQAVEALGGEWR